MDRPIEDLIPQRSPFLFVDKVLEFSETEVRTVYSVKADNPLVRDAVLQPSGLIENMAQSAAAMEGCNAILNHAEVKVGFIGSVKKFEVNASVSVDQILDTKVKVVTTAMGVNIVEGVVSCDGLMIAKATLNIFLKEEN